MRLISTVLYSIIVKRRKSETKSSDAKVVGTLLVVESDVIYSLSEELPVGLFVLGGVSTLVVVLLHQLGHFALRQLMVDHFCHQYYNTTQHQTIFPLNNSRLLQHILINLINFVSLIIFID